MGKFIDILPDKFKRNLRQHFLTNTGPNTYNFFKIYNDRIIVKNEHKGSWHYPLMDENENILLKPGSFVKFNAISLLEFEKLNKQ